MTATTDDASTAGAGDPPESVGAGESAEAVEPDVAGAPALSGTVVAPPARGRHLRRRTTGEPMPSTKLRQRRRRMIAALGLLVVLGSALALAGRNLVLDSTAGQYVEPGLQPGDPHYVALVTPTPTLLVTSVHEDELVGVALLALHPGDEGGSVLTLPVQTRVPDQVSDSGRSTGTDDSRSEGEAGQPGDDVETLAGAWASEGTEGVTEGVERILRVGVTEGTLEVNDDGWASMLESVEPLTLGSPDPVGDRWPAGRLELEADETGEFLRTQGDQESELNRTARQAAFWQAWLSAVAVRGEFTMPGEDDAVLARFVQGLGRDQVAVPSVPMEVTGSATADGGEYFDADEAAVAAIVARDIPYPQEPENGARTRVSLLNGTSDADLGLRASRPLVEAGAEIAVTGNAASFSEPQTRVIYAEATQRRAAVGLRNALGVGQIEQRTSTAGPAAVDEAERIDVTVILGADAPEAIRRLETTG